jgi:octaprenyl-diphosphate synthase
VVRKASITNKHPEGDVVDALAVPRLYASVEAELHRACALFDDELYSELPFLNELCAHIRLYRGKMLRPALLLLSGKAAGKLTDAHVTLAAVVEMVHMATLVHDDVLDDADVRRRCATVHRSQGNEAAILLGDYLISHAFHLCSSLDSQFASRAIGAATNTVCEGEIQQVHYRGRLDLTQTQYLEIVSRKTAALTGVCCMLGAHVADATVAALQRFGLNVGIAFQITDDVLDIVGSEAKTGKTLGKDLEKRKLTLPVIHCLQHGPEDTRAELSRLLQDGATDRTALREVLSDAGSLRFASQTARDYVASAVAQLEVLASSEARNALRQLALLILDREQ